MIALEDYHHLLPLATAFGNSSAASTDRIRFGVSARLFLAQYRSGHFGPKRGVIVHDMISDQYSHPCLQLIQVHQHETYVTLDEMMHCDTELSLLAMMTDAHSPSSPIRGICVNCVSHNKVLRQWREQGCYTLLGFKQEWRNLFRCYKFRRRAY